MLRLDLLTSLSLDLSNIDYNETNAIRYEKLILAEVKLSDNYEIQDAMNLMEFFKSLNKEYKEWLNDKKGFFNFVDIFE